MRKNRLCNFFVIIVSLCVSNGHACLSLNGQWKFSCFLMCVSSHTWTRKIIEINECRKHRTIYLEHISHTRTWLRWCLQANWHWIYCVNIDKSRTLFARNIFRRTIVIRHIKVAKKLYSLAKSNTHIIPYGIVFYSQAATEEKKLIWTRSYLPNEQA